MTTTERRNLRTGRSYWLGRRAPRIAAQPLRKDIKTEVLIVGAGISGSFLAEALCETHRVVVVDRRGPATGSTPASTALIEFEIDTPLVLLADKIGRRDAIRAWRRSRLAVTALAERTRRLGIDCDLVERSSLYLSGDILDAEGIAAEAEARQAAGIETEFLSRHALKQRFGIARSAALLAFNDYAADPRRLALGYLDVAVSRGTEVYAPVDVTDIETHSGGIVAATGAGHTIRAETIIFCTGYERPLFVPGRKHRVASTYAIATRPQKRRLWPGPCLVWEASDPYLYVRDTPGGAVICGGEDEDFLDPEARDGLLPRKTRALEKKLARLFPELDSRATYAWTGSFGVTSTGLPLIGRVPGKPHCWAVLGFGGNGITYAQITAQLIRTELTGSRDPDGDLYAFT
ncbi:MAG TPA: FAD-dependent oxidoreductase [Bauldia sp.]|nr:FAD-dependent oxidoreductase [Bauldia sp.]